MYAIEMLTKLSTVGSLVAPRIQLTKLLSTRGTAVCALLSVCSLLQWEAMGTTLSFFSVTICLAHFAGLSQSVSTPKGNMSKTISVDKVWAANNNSGIQYYKWWGWITQDAGGHVGVSSSMYPVNNNKSNRKIHESWIPAKGGLIL